MVRVLTFAVAASLMGAPAAEAQPQAVAQGILDRQSRNGNERGWLQAGIRDAEARLNR